MDANKDKLAKNNQTGEAVPRAPGDELASLRGELGLTQEQLAGRLGYSRSVVANAEKGRGISSAFIDRFAQTFPSLAQRLYNLRTGYEQAEGALLTESESADMFLRRATPATNLDGRWFALWESTADNEEVINAEAIDMKMRRGGVLYIQNLEKSPDNPKGGYLWVAECRVYDNQYILGTYIAREPNVRSKGSMYLVIHRSGRYIDGQWIGCNYDHDWARGLVVFAREPDNLPELLKKHRQGLPPMPYGKKGTSNPKED